LATALNSTAPYGGCTSGGVYHGSAVVPLGAMYSQSVRFTIGWPNVQSLMPKVLRLLATQKISLDAIHTVAPWDNRIDALKDPPAKLIFARDEAAR